MLLIPYNTDAPIYHWPFATICIIIVNWLVFAVQVAFPTETEQLYLEFGTINPLQWVTSFFMHADFLHVVGNMIFLWVFGLIVEGKIGWWRFLLVYFTIGISVSVFAQLVMLGSSGALGASAAIFGIMAMAMAWAPTNNIIIKFILIFIYYPIVTEFEASVLGVAFFFLSSNFFWAFMTEFEMSSQFIHLSGALVGGAMAMAMLRLRWVNCEGFDIVAMVNGKLGEKPEPSEAEIKLQQQTAEIKRLQFQEELRKFNDYVQNERIQLAMMKLTHLKRINPRFRVDKQVGWKMVQGLVKTQKIQPAVELIEEMIGQHSEWQIDLILNLAYIYLEHCQRPRKSIATLNRLGAMDLTAKQISKRTKIREMAFQQIDGGQIEIGD